MTSKKAAPLPPTAGKAKPAARRAAMKKPGSKAAAPAASPPRAATKAPAATKTPTGALAAVGKPAAARPPTQSNAATKRTAPVSPAGATRGEKPPARAGRQGGAAAAGAASDPVKGFVASAVVGGATGMVTLTEASHVVRKPRPVRDSFTMTEAEYGMLGTLKQACLDADYEVKKSELVRVGIALVAGLDVVALKDLLAALVPVKAGRAKKV